MKPFLVGITCLVCGAIGAAAEHYMGRYSIVHLSGYSAYRYDRWTGETWFLEGGTIQPVAAPVPPPPPVARVKPKPKPKPYDWSAVAEPAHPQPAKAEAKPIEPYAQFAGKDPFADVAEPAKNPPAPLPLVDIDEPAKKP